MKKIIVLLAALVVMMMSLAACGSSYTCDFCGEDYTGKRYEATVGGEKITICPDCYKELQGTE